MDELEGFILETQNEIRSRTPENDIEKVVLGAYCSCDSFYGGENYETSYKPTLFTTLNFSFFFVNGRISNLQGYFSGWTFANEYSLISSSIEKNCDSYTIRVGGTYDYLLFVEGIGTIYRQKVNHRITLPCNGGIVNVDYYEP